MMVLAARLSRKINSPWLAALLGLVLIGAAIDGLVNKDMPTVFVVLIMAVGVMNLRRLLPPTEEPVAE